MNLGIDIIEVKRIKKLIKNKKFLKRIFTDGEVKYCFSKKNFAQHFAVRFAAKEAIWKALGQRGITHKDIGIKNTPSGMPLPQLKGKLKKLEKKISISLSHTKEYAVAVAILK